MTPPPGKKDSEPERQPRRPPAEAGLLFSEPPPLAVAAVALNLPLDEPLDYEVPEVFVDRVRPGTRVLVPLGNRKQIGICVDLKTESTVERLRSILDVLDDEPLLDASLLELGQFIARYYCCSPGEALAATLPGPVRRARSRRTLPAEILISLARPRKEVEIYVDELPPRFSRQAEVLRLLLLSPEPISQREILARTYLTNRSPIDTLVKKGIVRREVKPAQPTLEPDREPPEGEKKAPPEPTPEQRLALDQILPHVRREEYRTILILGVTGSGKTELYLRSIEAALARGRKAIVLIPEIALTPQTVRRFRDRFERIAVLHSHQSDRERLLHWRAIRRNEIDVVIGARSAVFAPLEPLGMIIVDEEHEPTYKQQSTPRYQARDLAIVRARTAQAVVLLGSATPSLESFENACRRKYELVQLNRRIGNRSLPVVEVVDMGREHAEAKRFTLLSRRLVTLMKQTLDRREQVLLFLNRRGFSTIVRCKRCGKVVGCSQCDISMTYHQSMKRLLCHYCGREALPPTACPDCEMPGVSYLGLGTEKIEEELKSSFPGATVARMDSDSMVGIGSYERTLDAFHKGEVQILVGTQMIAKGHDFPQVTLVGILLADIGLNLPDFRSAERTFQLVAQAAGRSGRGDQPGRVILQAYSTNHYSLSCGAQQDYREFANQELAHRKAAGYPPFGKLCRIVTRPRHLERARDRADEIRLLLRSRTGPEDDLKILGPAPLFRVRGMHRFQILLRSERTESVLAALHAVRRALGTDSRSRVTLDMDPTG